MKLLPAFIYRRIAHRPHLVRVVDNISWLFLDKALRMGVGLVVGAWVARYLGPQLFGVLNFATAFVALFGAIAGLGLQGVVVRDIVREPHRTAETLGAAVVLQLLGGLVAYGLLLIAIFWLRPEDELTRAVAAILGSVLLLKASEVTAFWFEAQVQSKYIVWAQNSAFLLFAVVKVVLILSEAALVAFAFATVAEALIVSLLMLVAFGLRGPRCQLAASALRARSLLRDSWPLLLSGITILIYMKMDQIMLGQLVGDGAVGVYSAAVRLSELWYFIPTMIVASVFPAILEAKERGEAQYYLRLQRLYDLMVWLALGIALPMTFISDPIVVFLFGEEYSDAGTVLSIHIWAGVFVFLGVASSRWLLAENRQLLAFQRTALGAVVNVVLNLILIPRYSMVGAAVATVTSQALAALIFDLVQPETRFSFFMKLKAMNILRLILALR